MFMAVVYLSARRRAVSSTISWSLWWSQQNGWLKAPPQNRNKKYAVLSSKDVCQHFSITDSLLCLSTAPQDPPQRGRSFSLTSHQLRCLTQLTNTLLELEQTVEDLATHLGFLNCAGESVCSGKGKNVTHSYAY